VIAGDRRAGRRLVIDPQSPLRLSLKLFGHPITARILDLSESGLSAEIDDFSHGLPAEGAELEEAFLGYGDGTGIRLSALAVQRNVIASGRAVLTLITQHPETQAALWHAMLRINREGELLDAKVVTNIPQVLPRIPQRTHYTEEARLRRLEWLRNETRTLLTPLTPTRLAADRLSGNIENLIGAVEVPVGVAGPLLIHGQHIKGLAYAPMATTEGALVASTTRGAMALSRSGGVTTRVIRQQMMRVPLFVLTNLRGATVFANWIRDHVGDLRRQVGKVSQHARLVSVEPVIMGNMVHVHFLYETGDAAGQNMTTACTWQACQWLMAEMRYFDDVEFENFVIEGNASGDKKVNYNSLIAGRGIRVIAECIVKREILRKVLDTTPEQLTFLHASGMAGSIGIGTVGYNINVANVVAAIFTATGQDIACVHESGLGLFNVQAAHDGVYLSMVMPSLVIGTVGGGTHLPAQNALLEMMGCGGRGKVARFAEIIAGFCLALDLSTMSAVASGQFANAHERLGRNRPVRWFAREDLSPAFFEPGARRVLGDDSVTIERVEEIPFEAENSIIAELTARKLKKLVGLMPMRLHWRGAAGGGRSDVFVKSKPLDEESMVIMNGMAQMCGPRVFAAWRRFKDQTVFKGTHKRELAIVEQTDERIRRHMPRVWDTFRDDAREAYVIVMEQLTRAELIDAADDVRGWTRDHVEAALRGVAEVHAVWLGREDELRAQPWLGTVASASQRADMRELWDSFAVHAANELPHLMTPAALDHQRALIDSMATWWPRLEAMPRTLIHNDFNPRNVAIVREDGGALRMVAYDWELATLHVPQRDLAEMLAFVLYPTTPEEDVDHYLEVHRLALERASGRTVDPAQWREGYALALRDLLIDRFAYYLVAHTFRHYAFMERAFRTLRHLIEIEAGRFVAA
jgi:NADP-dependent 3-hydroxy-3-methylglutaryl-CoA reductase